jgi:hypothetical protein
MRKQARKKMRRKKLRKKKNKESKLTCKLLLDVLLVVVEVLLYYKKWLTTLFVMVASKYLSVAKIIYQVTNATTTRQFFLFKRNTLAL